MKHILVVDDESLIRYSLSAALQSNDTEVITSPSGRDALKALGDWHFEFCFLDIHLPDMSGIDIMKTIRLTSPATKVIMMTGSYLDARTMEIIRQNAYLFLAKPFDLFRVKRVLEGVSSVDKNVFHELSELEARVAERRRHRRQEANIAAVTYAMMVPEGKEQKQYHTGDMVDISDSGARIRTTYHLEPGSMIRFKNSVNNAAGIVRWSATEEQNDVYVAGIQFIGSDRA